MEIVQLKGGDYIITLILNSNKSLSAVNHAKVYYGENRIGEIKIVAADTIGSRSLSECELTLYIKRDGYYVSFPLVFNENNICTVPITDDITEYIGIHKLHIGITADNHIIGMTNNAALRVYPSHSTGEEIIRREVYIARIEELEERIEADDRDFLDIKNAISLSGVTISDDTPTSEYGNLVREIPVVVLADIFAVIEGTFTGAYEIPRGITRIGDYFFYHSNLSGFIFPDTVTALGTKCFSNCSQLTSITLPDSITSLGTEIFEGCSCLSAVTFGSGITDIPYRMFYSCISLRNITIPGHIYSTGYQAFVGSGLTTLNISHGVQQLGDYSFAGISALTTVSIPNTITNTGNSPFNACSNLINVTIENGFNADNLTLSSSSRYTADTIVSWLNALADRTGQSAYTLRIGSNNINKLSSAQIAIATNKNWNLA